jgi:PAS domain S-box-containing protein
MRETPQPIAQSVHPRVVRAASIILASYAVIGGSLTLYGWQAYIPRLTDWNNDGISMFVNTAICAAACGVAVLFLHLNWHAWWVRFATSLIGMTVAVVGGLTWYQNLTGVNLGIDTLVIYRPWGFKAATAPMRMGPPAATSFMILGLALILATRSRLRGMSSALAACTMAIASLSLVGYWYGADQLFGVARSTGIAFQTSTMLAAIGAALVTAIPDRQPARLLQEESAAGVLARRGLPIILLLPLLLGWLRVRGQNAGVFDFQFGTALQTIVEIALLAALGWWAVSAVAKHERRVRESEDRLRLAQQAANWGVFEYNYETGWAYWSPEVEALYGLSRGGYDHTYEGWRRRVHPDDRARAEHQMERAMLTGEFAQDYRVVWNDGTIRWLYSRGKVFYDANGRPSRMVGVNVDITDRKQIEHERANRAEELSAALERRTREVTRAEKALARVERMAAVGTMASGLAHDMNNVLLPLSARLDLLLRASTLSGEERSNLTVVAALIDHLRAMSKSLALFARDPDQEGLEGFSDLSAWSESVKGLMEASLMGKSPGASAERVRLQWDIPRDLPAVNVAPHRLTQAVLNLVHNARDAILIARARGQHSQAGGITVAARKSEDEPVVELKVIDDGCGMDEQTIQRCIEPFYTTKDRPAAPGMSGSGMGLTLAHAICERVGGQLEIKSKLGEGTAVTMLLPIVFHRDDDQGDDERGETQPTVILTRRSASPTRT